MATAVFTRALTLAMWVSFGFPLSCSLAGKGAKVGDAEAIKIARALEKNTSLKELQ